MSIRVNRELQKLPMPSSVNITHYGIMNDRFYTVPQVASMVGMSHSDVLRLFPLVKFGNMIRVKEADIQITVDKLSNK
jgi:hypothetical protein